MAIKHILGLLACSLLLASCEFLTQEPTEGKINYVAVGITYTGTNDNLDTLTYTDDDAVSLAKAFALWGSHSGRTPSGKKLTSNQRKANSPRSWKHFRVQHLHTTLPSSPIAGMDSRMVPWRFRIHQDIRP
ncbi:MAG: hypothetical protein LKE39_02160 [Sphaerochaeta sp.]|jgi:hypothetical protein|nr:hypothetical protein [Sphaerochaeta sp.]